MQEQTRTIPIVTSGGDILANGIVKNVARPEGNITGFMNAFGILGSKWLELLKEAAPNITRVANLFPLVNSNNSYRLPIAATAQSLGLQLVTIPVSDVAGMRAAIEATHRVVRRTRARNSRPMMARRCPGSRAGL